MKKMWVKCLTLCMVVALLAACAKEKPVLDKLAEDGSGKLKVMYYDEENFYREYGSYFTIKYPNIEIEVVNTNSMYQQEEGSTEPVDPQKKLMELIDKEQPDIIFTDIMSMKKLVDEGKLYDMDPIAQQEQFNFDDMLPGLIDLIREQGNGGLYGLAPKYYTNLLFYNADLFKQYNIEPPTNKMSWSQIIELGARFNGLGSGDDHIYGMGNEYRDASTILMDVAQTNNLQFIDANAENVLLDSPAWRDTLSMVAKAIKDKTIEAVQRDNNGGSFEYKEPSFSQSKAAMTIDGTYNLNRLDNSFQWNKELKPFEWGVVTVPVDPNNPDVSSNVSVNEVFAISANAVNKRTAWELVKFITSPEVAKASSKVMDGRLPTRVTNLKEMKGKNTEALTMLKPKVDATNVYQIIDKHKISYDFYGQMQEGLNKALNDMIAGKSVDEVIPPLATQLQKQLVEAKKKGNEQQAAAPGVGAVVVSP